MPNFQLRKCERYTNWEATNVVDLNPEEFVEYIQELYYEDWYDICDQLEEDGRTDLADQLAILFEGDMEIYSSTTDKYATEWFDIGEADEEYTKYGGFNGRHNTLSED